MEAVNGVSEGDKGGPPPPSPLTGCYLLIVIGEPHCNEHKDIILQRVAKGLLSWDVNGCLVDLEKELSVITEQALEGEEARYGERLIQFASENLVTEILIHPVVSTLAQCVRNLLSSFTRHRHIIHAGYTFANNGSWVLQDGTFSLTDFCEAFQEIEVLRVIRAYENGISIDIHCSPEGDWTRLPKEPFTKGCKVRVNPNDVLTAGSPSITSFVNYVEPFLIPAELEAVLESSDVVGNIRFSRPTLYVFPGGQGDAALFGINGFNMLLDGGFSRKACFWDFVRHLDRLDAVLLTRLNNSNVCGISSILKRKRQNALYPQIGHFFCNIQERKAILSPDGDKDKDPLLINLLDEGQEIVSNLRHLSLNPQVCYRDSEPINLYHKVGHGTLDMYVLSPAKDSKEVREFLQKWNNNDQKLFANPKTKDFVFPLQNLVSICALLVWQPANPEDTITRILFPGSSPQNKIFEGLDRIKSLDFIKHPVCSEKSLAPATIIKAKQSVIDRILPAEKKILDNKKEKPQKPADPIIDTDIKNGEVNGVQTEKSAPVKKSDSTESEKSVSKPKKIIENGDNVDKVEKTKPKPKSEPKTKPRSDSQPRRSDKKIEKKPSPTTPKKQIPKSGEEPKPKPKPSPTSTPAKSAKEANNRKVVESKKSAPAVKKEPAKPSVEKKDVKTERKPISRRPKDTSKPTASPSKKVNGVQKPDSISRRGKLDKEGTTDSSTVSTPSAEQDSILKKDISKLTPDEIQKLKAQELADLKEEQEAVKEIEAVFRKGELQADKPSDFRKVKDISIDDKLESEEYLIIEKTEIVQDLANESNKEEETQKIARDSEESEKQKKPSDEKLQVEEKREEIEDEVHKIITSATDAVKSKEEAVEASKEPSVTSPEEKVDVSSKKEEEVKEVAQESQPDEKGSGNIESGATTTAPTLPEDERMPLDEIKEDNGDQVIEEKHVKEDTKEKEVPVIQLPPKTVENIAKLPPVVGIRLDKQAHMRDVVKTPDEVADLPVHEEVEFDHYEEYHASEIKAEAEEAKKEETAKTDDKDKVVEDKAEKKEADEKDKTVDKVVENKAETKESEEKDKPIDVTVDKEKTEVGVKDVETKDGKAVPEVAKEDTAVISEDLNKKELSKSPDEEKDTDEHELEEKKHKEVDIKEEKVSVESKEQKQEQETKKEAVEQENVVAKKINDDKLEEQQNKTQLEEVKEAKATPETEISEKTKKIVENEETQASKEAEKSDAENKKTEDAAPKEDEKLEELKEKLPEVPKDEIKPILTEAKDIEKPSVEKDIEKIQQIDEKLQKLNEQTTEVKGEKKEESAVETKEKTKPKEEVIEKIDERLQKLKDDDTIKGVSEVITHKVEEPQHAESVIITADSLPESPCVDEKKIDDKLELGRKSPKEREEDVAKIVASVAEVLKSDAPLEEFEGKIPFNIPYTSYTTELRETHITTVGSPVANETKGVKESFCPKSSSTFLIEEERKIAPIHEEPEPESRINRMIENSNDLIQATSKMIHDIKQPPIEKIDEEPGKEEQDGDSGTVHRMLVTASSEDGGEETEICPAGTITFSRSSESSGRSSPDPQSQKLSQKSSTSDATVINKKDSDKDEAKDIKEPVIDSVCDTAKLDKKDESEAKDSKHKEETKSKPEDKKDTTVIKDKKDEKSSQDAVAKTEEKKTVEEIVTEQPIEKQSITSVQSEVEKQKQEDRKDSVGELQEKLVNETDAALKEVKETIKKVEEKIDAKVEDVTKQVEKEKSILSGVVNDIGTSLLEDTTKLIEDAQKHVQEMKDGAKEKIEDLKKDMVTEKEKYDTAAKHIEEKIKKETSAVSETVGKVEENVKEDLIKEKNTLIDSAMEIEKSIVEKAQTVTEEAKSQTENVKETVNEKVSEIKETVTKQEETIVGTVSETSQTLAKDIESKTLDMQTVVEETKEKTKTEIEETLKSVNEKVEEKITSLEKSVTHSTDDSKQIIEESKKLLEDTKEKLSEKMSSEMKVVEEKTKDMLEQVKVMEETLKKSVVEESKYLEEKLDVNKQKVVEKFETFTKDLEKTEVSTEEKETDEKYNLFNGLESVEKMVVDVLTADREEAKPKEENKKDTSGILEKVESEVEEIVEKGVEEVKELVHDAKEAITHLFKHEPSKDEVLEKVADDIKENYEAVTEMAKSVVFEKCEKPEEEHKQLEKQLETSVHDLENEFAKVSDMATSVVFDKCEKSPTDHKKEENKEENNEEKKDEMKEEKKEEQLEKSAKDLEKEFEKVTDMAKTMSFEKCEKVSDVEKEENVLEKSAQNLEKEFEAVSDMAKSIHFDKCEKPPSELEKEEKQLEKIDKALEKEFETVSEMAKSLHFEKCEKPVSEVEKEEQQLEKIDKAIEKEYDIVNDLSNSLVFQKCEKPSEEQKAEKVLEKSAQSIEKDHETMTDMSKSTVFEKCEKPPTEEQKEEKVLEKSAQDIEKEYETVSKMVESVTFDKCDASKEDPKNAETKESLPSPPKSPKTLESKGDVLPGKSSPEPSSTKNLPKEDSGKSTPETKEMDHIKVDNQDSLLSGKSSPGLSGKSSPILSESSLGANAESKDSLLSGKSTPEPGNVESLSGKSDKAKPDEKEQSESGKTSPKPSVKDTETEKETKSDVKPADKEEEKVEANTTLNKEKKTEIEKEVTQSPAEVKKPEKVDDTKPTEQSPTKTEEKPLEASASDLSKSESAETKDISLDSGIDTEVETKKKQEEKKEVKTDKPESVAGPSLTQETVTSLKTSSEDLHLSGKSTPDIAEVEKMRELQDIKQEKHILGSSTPPTVPVSPVVKEKPEEKPSSTPIKSAITSVKDNDVRSCTPGSDDYEVGASTHSDISSGQASRAPPVLEGERIESDEDDDVPGSPMSVTSQVAHSRSSSRYDFDDERIGTKLDPMNTSFYGALPDDETDLDFDKALTEHRQTRGEDLVYEESPSYLYEVTKAKYSRTPEPENLDQINKNGAGNVMTASFMGNLPASSGNSEKKDAFDAWGKPLGLPSPAPPNDNKGTPKKERKLPPNVSAKNKLNDDKKRSESPSKFRNKKYNPVYVDLTYVPHHGNAYYSYVDFFKRVRARYYVFSGIEPSRDVYNALLEAKQTWEDKELEVTIIPTYDTDILGYWVAENEELLSKYKIDLSPSASRCTINLQDHETSCSAYRLEF